MKHAATALALALALLTPLAHGGEVGFLEDFALAKDRSAALKQLIPGTRDYYYYHCLHYQNSGRLDEAERMLGLWIKRYKRAGRVPEIENRQALLRYGAAPADSLKHIVQQLGLKFDHQRERLDRKLALPTRLDPKAISRQTLTARALARHKGTLGGFEDRALEWAITLDLDPNRRRHLLSRLRRPDLANLPKLIVDDLNHKNSRGFGSLGIHRQLLLAQLDECLKLKADLLSQTRFVQTYLTRLFPNPDVDWRHDPKEREAFLDRLWGFVLRLNPSHNSLKAHVLYHRLVHERAKGNFDKARFMAYIQLPRHASYVNSDYMKDPERRRYAVNLNADFSRLTLLPRIGNDEPLVRSYLLHFFKTEDSFAPYATTLNDLYLKHTFAEAKIVNGIGDMERWYSMIPPATYQRLKERIDLDFAHTSREVFAPDAPVSLDLHIKNVKTLLVKVYEINTLNYYRSNRRQVDTRIELDGLVANEEKTYTYVEPPLRRVTRHFDFPKLSRRGVFVIEFIGNGRSSRAVIRKGRLRYLVRTSTAGHVFTILDENNKKLPKADLWLAGHRYTPDKKGTLTAPFSNRPGRQPIILTLGDFASLDQFDHEAERYSLSAGIHADREALLSRRKATVAVRPELTLNGEPVTLSVLEEPTLVITSVDREGVSTTKEVHDFKLHEDRESTYEFQTPANLARLTFTLKAKVQNLSQSKKLNLQVSRQLALNGIDKSEKIEDLHLGRAGGDYLLDLLGKTGEPKPGRPVHVTVKHRDFRDTVTVSLQTDANGRVALGALAEIDWVRARGPEGTQHTWHLTSDRHSYPAAMHGKAGEVIALPYMGAAAKPLRSELSLLELRGSAFVTDRFSALAIENGFLEVRGLPRGDYDLVLKDSGTRIAVRLTAGTHGEGHVLAESRLLQVRNPKPLQIAAVTTDPVNVKVRLANATKFARVHVAATRFLPEHPLYASLDAVPFPGPDLITLAKAESDYVVGRDIGEEFRYILERKYARKFPGNMLKRPTLLLNPWAIRSTQTGRQEALRGTRYGRGRAQAKDGRGGKAAPKKRPDAVGDGFANLDFLAEAGLVLTNLRPDEDGVVTIKRADLGGHQQLQIVAVDPQNTVCRKVSLPAAALKINDLRLVKALDPAKRFTEQKQISVVAKGRPFVLPDLTTSTLETYDTLGRVYILYATLSSNPTLIEFGFILNWPKMKPAEKRETYSKYACHELNFFLHKKDPDFFKAVVLPYLKNKMHKTFLDHWLLGDDLMPYLEPWAFAQLNVVERILLARRIAAERPHMARHVKDLFDLLPPNIERFNHLFKTALKGRALDTGDALGIRTVTAELARAEKKRVKLATVGGGKATGAGLIATNGRAATRRAPKGAAFRDALKKLDNAKEELEEAAPEEPADDEFFADDADKRHAARQLYRKLDKTKEWVENNYYHLPIERQNASLITVNPFWNDYAQHDGDGGFFSTNLAEASRSFPEMMLALAVLDLPFEAAEHKSDFKGARLTLTPGSPMVVFHKEIKPAEMADEKTPILVSQNFFKHGDRYRHVGSERHDKYVTDEFVIHTVYGCHVVITNPTSARQKLDVLLQIPRGAIPVLNGQYTRSVHVDPQPYRTQTFEYYFYFPAPGKLGHYPVHVAKSEKLIAFAKPVTLNVVPKATKIDATSWQHISQHGTEDQVVAYLNENNLGRVNLDRIAWRMKDRAFFRKILALLRRRHAYNHTLWSYALTHNELAAARQYLQHSPFASRCGATIDSPLLTVDPVIRKTYQHMEYWPLVNSRSHRLGKARKILNDRFYQQYMRLLRVLSYRSKLDDDDRMSATYYLLLQERIEEALGFFEQVRPAKLATRLQYDYFTAYLGFYTDRLRRAREIAAKYADHPVPRWRQRFAAVAAQLDEIEGKAVALVDKEDRTEQQTQLAATEASFDFEVEARKITINYQSMASCQVRYYLMDIELLFSRNPFVEDYSGQFDYIRPNATQTIQLDPKKTAHTFDLPARFHSSNVRIEIAAGGVKKAKAYFANSLAVQIVENYGQLKVSHQQTNERLPKVYVKVYAQMKDGRVRFYKDGYTDLRGRFDYTSLNTNELDFVRKFSVLVLSDTHGAVVREAAAPKR